MSEFINPFAERDIFSEMRKAKGEEKRQAEEARRLAEEAEKKRQEEERLQREEAERQAEEARRLAEEAERKRQKEEVRRLAKEAETRRRTELAKPIAERMVLVERDSGDSFYIGKYPVTQKDWMSVMGSNPSYFKGENRPVECVTWYDAIEFCNKLSEKDGLKPVYKISKILGKKVTLNDIANGYRLPTNDEWEFAARGGKKSKGFKYYAGSDNLDEVAWVRDNSGDETHDVGLKKPNELGIYDMSGNVWEWCWDADRSGGRLGRGGSCHTDIVYGFCELDRKSLNDADNQSHYLGFRIVCSPSR